MAAQQGIIYIPDISGFTKFVSSTEIKHSRHIVSELMEVILDNNVLGFIPSEIEGDAVLFYKLGGPPPLKKLIEQTEKIFLEFHKFLRTIERTSVCRCGACQSSSHLTIKFIAHYGEIEEYKVKHFSNILGSDVILAHRLLKNTINLNEYLLLTKDYISTQPEENYDDHCKKIMNYENFGDVEVSYVSLKDLRRKVVVNRKDTSHVPENFSPHFSLLVDKPLMEVYQLLIDNEKKMNWVPGIKKINQDGNINRINHTHACLVNGMDMEFTTLKNGWEEDRMFFSEEGKVLSSVYFYNEFYLTKINGSTEIKYRMSYSDRNDLRKSVAGRLALKVKYFIFKLIFLGRQKKALLNFKSYCENR